MSIAHHPSEALLAAYGAGRLDAGEHIAIATHLLACAQCRAFVRAVEQAGGSVLAELTPVPLSADALASVEARLQQAPERFSPAKAPPHQKMAGLPRFVQTYPFDEWRSVAPALQARTIRLPHASLARVFLLKAGPGTRLLEHTHSGVEMTCVLEGGFSHKDGHFGPGDFDFGDSSVDHRPLIDDGVDCVCLVAMRGRLDINGILGRLIQPFVRL
ncbi:ChrR family anti-sigma-E factor [Rhizomicrobium electricum]|uniref:Anti-sigma-E factor ChrR n=1 Tax=Rhizomicrobium electricum TaxID=480070 RepID=A0ABN1F7R6_9PROT|nr:ChrR family anti-sigma-E factor [Rhizomicrobium electricum]NIJ46706.1 putative transcriptional regulator [Rhizomicrobium electricum]